VSVDHAEKQLTTSGRLVAVRQGDRQVEIDVWRGFALIGVCVVNFALANSALLSAERSAALITSGLDWRMDALLAIFLRNKAHTIFSFLFGLGVAIVVERSTRLHQSADSIVLRRMSILFAIGCIHCLILYPGDIVHTYALVGVALIGLRRLSDRWLAAVGLVLAVFSRLAYEESEFLLSLIGSFQGSNQGPAAGIDTGSLYALNKSMSILDFVRYNVQQCLHGALDNSRRFLGFSYYLGRAMLGFAFWRSGWAVRVINSGSGTIWRNLLIFASIGALITWYVQTARPGPIGSLHHFLYNAVRHVNFLVVSAAYIIALTGIVRIPFLEPFTRALSRIGRLSLTNYVGQSIGMMLIVFGPGLRLGGDVGTFIITIIALSFFGAQVLFSMLWLRRFTQGPLEFAWRKALYWGKHGAG